MIDGNKIIVTNDDLYSQFSDSLVDVLFQEPTPEDPPADTDDGNNADAGDDE